MNTKNVITHYQPELFTLSSLKDFGNKTLFRTTFRKSLLWNNYHLSADRFFEIVNQSTPFSHFLVSEILVNQSNDDLDCLLGETIEDLKKQVTETTKQQFNAYLEALKKELHNYVSGTDFFQRLNHKFINKNKTEEIVANLKNRIEIVSYFIDHKLDDSINLEVNTEFNFILPSFISNLIKTPTIYCVDLKGNDFQLGLNELNINNLHYKYDFFENKTTQEVEVVLTVKTKQDREFKNIHITKRNREQYEITSYNDHLFYFLEKQLAIDFVNQFIDKLKTSLK